MQLTSAADTCLKVGSYLLKARIGIAVSEAKYRGVDKSLAQPGRK